MIRTILGYACGLAGFVICIAAADERHKETDKGKRQLFAIAEAAGIGLMALCIYLQW